MPAIATTVSEVLRKKRRPVDHRAPSVLALAAFRHSRHSRHYFVRFRVPRFGTPRRAASFSAIFLLARFFAAFVTRG